MALKLWTLVILLLSCHLAPIIQAGKPVLAKSTHTIPKSSSVTTTTTPIKHVQLKNVGFQKQRLENLAKKADTHGTEASSGHIDGKQDITSYFPLNVYANPVQSPLQYPFTFPMPSLASMFDSSSFSPMAKFMSFFGYSQPLIIPYPVMMPSEMFYPSYTDSQPSLEDTMSRTSGTGRRPIHSGANTDFLSNSPIYYVRLPPTPYMFLPSFNYAPSPLVPYSPISAFHALPMSSIFNLPMNFLANGKPNGIYRIDGAPGELSNHNLPFPSARPTQFTNSFRPMSMNLTPDSPSVQSPTSGFPVHNPGSQFSFPSPSSSSPSTQHDSKLNTFKHPFVFNGRPEDIYILPNNFNPSIYSENSFF